jgi:hypothetical protein
VTYRATGALRGIERAAVLTGNLLDPQRADVRDLELLAERISFRV